MCVFRFTFAMACSVVVLACAEDNPDSSGDLPDAGPGQGVPCSAEELELNLDISQCQPAQTDYMPNENNSEDD